jgi:F-type H+-transporting ATPase subunit epsilon
MYHLSILTHAKTIFDGEVSSLIAPGTIGYLEILTDHAPIITSLQPGKLTVTDSQGKRTLYSVSGGVLEMVRNQATLLVDSIEEASEIDFARAKAAYERAARLLEEEKPETDLHRANLALLRAENRMKIYQEYHGKK